MHRQCGDPGCRTRVGEGRRRQSQGKRRCVRWTSAKFSRELVRRRKRGKGGDKKGGGIRRPGRTGWNAPLQWLRMNSLISSSVICSKVRVAVGWWCDRVCTYSVRVSIAHIEKVFLVDRVSFGLEYALHTFCATNAHCKPYSAYEDIQVVLRREEAIMVRR